MGRSWWRIAGLAAGFVVSLGGLAGALLSGRPVLAALFGTLLVAMLALAAYAALRARRPARAPRRATWLEAGLGSETVAAPPPSQAAGLEPDAQVEQARAPWPAGFDAAAFLRAAKEKYIRLQVAAVRGRLEELRDVITTDLYDHLRAGGAARHRRDVVTLQASLLEVATEAGRHRASVRFSGLVCAVPGTEASSFEQVWNLVKPVDSANGWLLAGVQQMH